MSWEIARATRGVGMTGRRFDVDGDEVMRRRC